MLALMATETFDNGLRAAVPAAVAVAHKTGNWDGATHDAGIVLAPRGPYVIVLLSARAGDSAVIKNLASLVYTYFESNP